MAIDNKNFIGYFCTQFLGAFNDNLYKNALLILIAFHWSSGTEQDHFTINLAAALFILPFFLFSPLAGSLADRGNKVILIQRIKLLEIILMALASAALLSGKVNILLALLFLMGSQSALFGPVKYAIIPELSDNKNLLKANALVGGSTYVAILLGTIGGGFLASINIAWVCAGIISFACLGWLSSLFIDKTTPRPENQTAEQKPNSENNTAEITEDSLSGFSIVKQQPFLLNIILLISWFWLQGAAWLTQIPTLARDVLQGSPSTVTLLLSLFTLSVAAGAAVCAYCSHHKINMTLIKTGIAGFILGGCLLMLAQTNALSVYAGIIITGLSGGLYIVPLYTLLQHHSQAQQRARVFAVNNVFNALFMVCSALLGMLLLGKFGLSIALFLCLISLGNMLLLGLKLNALKLRQ